MHSSPEGADPKGLGQFLPEHRKAPKAPRSGAQTEAEGRQRLKAKHFIYFNVKKLKELKNFKIITDNFNLVIWFVLIRIILSLKLHHISKTLPL